ncbi:ras guanine nucleotide exchange factor domain-containing protein [Mycena vulgaris]|nr:ras guanine nucleotide exchange factor domain-containing protein [Mycena vulgaris]
MPAIVTGTYYINSTKWHSGPPATLDAHHNHCLLLLLRAYPSSSQVTPQTVPPAQAIFKKESGKIYGNSLGLMDHLLETDDENFKHVMLRTYLDYASSYQLFDVIERRFREVKPEMGHFVKRFRIIDLVVAWLEVVPQESDLFHRVGEFASATQSGFIPDHKQRILTAIKAREKPVEPGELAIAFPHIEGDLYKEVCLIDYLWHSRGLPSHLDTVLSNHHKMIGWVKYSVLRHDEMQDRAVAMKRFVKAGRPMSDFSRTLGILSKKTRASLEQIVELVDPDDNYNAYRGAKNSSAGNHIPWFSKFTFACPFILPYYSIQSVAELDEMNSDLSQYPRTVGNLINFERYRRLARRLPQVPLPTQVEGTRQQRHIAHLWNQFTDNIFDYEAKNQRRRKLKIKEEEDHQNCRLELKALGLA